MQLEVEAYLRRKYEGQIADVEIVDKEDLDLVSNCVTEVDILLLAHTHPYLYLIKKKVYVPCDGPWIIWISSSAPSISMVI